MNGSRVNGSKDSRDAFYRLHAAAAFRRARRLLGSDADADDVVHDVFLSLFERPDHARHADDVTAYLYGAVTHACLNRIRNGRNRRRLTEEHRQQEAATMHDPGTATEWKLTARVVLAQMPDDLSHVAIYYYVDELSQREIGEIMGCSHRHVGNLLARVTRWAKKQEDFPCRP